ncbi:MAG: cation transporting ATPase C-terminal domain-containing protein, partial [Bacteroidales bacterium]
TVNNYNMTLFFTVFVMMQFVNMFFVRGYAAKREKGDSLKNIYPIPFLLVAFLIFAGQILIVQFGGEAFRVEPLTLGTWGWITLCVAVALGIDFVVKVFKK